MNNIPVSLKGITKKYGNFSAVDKISFSMNSGEILGFLGPNGAGKSTCLKMICGFLKPTEGNILVYGKDPFESGVEVRKEIGVVPEELQIYDRLTGRELVEFSAKIHQIKEDVYLPWMKELFKMMDLELKIDQFVMDYSHGMKKKLALIISLIHKPKVLFLDEPFTGMDALSVIRVRKLLESLKEDGMSIFFSSHILEVVEKVCDRIAIIFEGKLKAIGTKEELLEKFGISSIEDIFLNLSEKD